MQYFFFFIYIVLPKYIIQVLFAMAYMTLPAIWLQHETIPMKESVIFKTRDRIPVDTIQPKLEMVKNKKKKTTTSAQNFYLIQLKNAIIICMNVFVFSFMCVYIYTCTKIYIL
jgi:hypothetical protein